MQYGDSISLSLSAKWLLFFCLHVQGRKTRQGCWLVAATTELPWERVGAPGLGKPVLVMRDTTERPEALESGTVHLVGTNHDLIINEVSTLLDDPMAYETMSKAVNPYGDGKACQRIARILNGEDVAPYVY